MRAHSKIKFLAIIIVLNIINMFPAQSADAQTFQSCLVEEEDDLYIRLRERARAGYSAAHQEFDFETHLRHSWRNAGMTTIIATAASEAGSLYGGDGFFQREANRRLTSYSRSRAEAAVKTIAEQTFSSPEVRAGFEDVIEATLDRFLTFLSQRSKNVALDMGHCFSEFLTLNFPPIVQSAANEYLAAIQTKIPTGGPDPRLPNLSPTTAGILGAALVALGTIRGVILKKITGQVVKRIITRLATRAIPYIGWALIAFEIIWQHDGSVPEIVDSMTDPKIIDGFQVEIGREIQGEVGRQIPLISQEIVSATMKSWKSFVADNQKVLELSQSNPRFRKYLEQFSSDADLAPVRDAVALIVGLGGEEALNDIIDRNQMSQVLNLSVPGRQLAKKIVARKIGTLQTALEWSERVPDRLEEVASSDLYLYKTPMELTPSEIEFVLDLSETELIRNTALLPANDVSFLSQIDHISAQIMLETLPPDGIQDAVRALQKITTQNARNTIWRHISGDRYQATRFVLDLQTVGVSKDQDLAAQLVFVRASFLNPVTYMRLTQSIKAAAAGDVNWLLVFQAYHALFILLAVIIIALIIRGRLRRPRQQEVVIRHEKQD